MNRMFEEYKKLPKEIYILSIATLINRIGDFVVPFLTLYLSEKIGLSLPATGIIVAITGFAKIPGNYLGGRLNDKYNSKTIFVMFQTISALLLIPCSFVFNPFITVPLIIIFSVTSAMVRTPTMAMISDLLPTDQRKLGYTVRYIGINIGVAIGLSIAGFMYNYSITLLFLADAATMLISVILIFLYIKRGNLARIREQTIGSNEKAEEGNVVSALLKRKHLIFYMLFLSFILLIFEQTKFAMPLTVNNIFGENGPILYGFLISINAVTATFLALFQGVLFKKISTLSQLVIGGILFTVGFGLYGLVDSYPLFIISTIIWSIGEVFIFTNTAVFIINNSPENFRGRFTSLFSIISSTIATLGIMGTERLISIFGLFNSWYILSLFTLISTVLLYLLKLRSFRSNI